MKKFSHIPGSVLSDRKLAPSAQALTLADVRQPGAPLVYASEAEFGKIELFDEGVDDADRVIRIHIILKTRRQKARLMTVSTFNETTHMAPPQQCQIIA